MQRGFERALFASRRLLAPMSTGLGLSLVVLLVMFARRGFALALLAFGPGEAPSGTVIVGILSLVDLSLLGNLVLMVIFAGYETFVSRIDAGSEAERLGWMGQVGFGDLKLKLMASIVAILAIHVLEAFMELHETSDRDLAWTVGLHLTFVASGLLLALMDRMMGKQGALICEELPCTTPAGR